MPLIATNKKAPAKQIRWYNPRTGRSCHGADLRAARREGLVPSVTEVMAIMAKPWLERWKQEQCIISALTLTRHPDECDDEFCDRILMDSEDKARRAAGFGTEIHAACEVINKGGAKPRPDSPILQHIEHYWNWWLKNVTHVVAAEEVVVNPEAGYAGRCDMEAYLIEHNHVVCDIKTQQVKGGKPNFYDSWGLQLAAYGKPKGINKGVSIVINSEQPEPPYIKVWEDLSEHYTAFEHCLALWRYEKGYYPKKGDSQCKSGN